MKRHLSRIHGFLLIIAITLVVPSWGFAQEKPNLFVVSVGVSKYEDKRFEGGVVYSAKDAQNVADSFLAQRGKRYNRVEAKILLDNQATGQNIRAAIDWLQKAATPDSHVLVFLSGHGGPNMLGAYEYTVHDTNPLVSSTRVQGRWLRERMQKIAGKRFLMLDTCHAGGFGFKDADFTAFASCGAKQLSGEKADLRNGYFTRCLLEGLQGKADLNFDGTVSIAELETYVHKNLPTLTQGRQQLTTHRPTSIAGDLPLVRLGSVVPFTKTGPRFAAQ
jgi:uncharacterized caspase-like protein